MLRNPLLLLPCLVGCASDLNTDRCGSETGVMADACWMATLSDALEPRAADVMEHCGHIVDPASADHCKVAAATTLQLPYGDASAVCDAVSNTRWRDECHFQALENNSANLDPGSYVAACGAKAGRYSGSCVDHGICYWVHGLTSGTDPIWFSEADLDDQLRSLQDHGARTRASSDLAQVLRWRVRGGRAPRQGVDDCAGWLRDAPTLHWRSDADPRWW